MFAFYMLTFRTEYFLCLSHSTNRTSTTHIYMYIKAALPFAIDAMCVLYKRQLDCHHCRTAMCALDVFARLGSMDYSIYQSNAGFGYGIKQIHSER